jgi:acetylornithine deacetylase
MTDRPVNGPIGLACELVAASSPNPPGDERAAADVAVRALRALGIDEVRVVGPSPQRPNVVARVRGTRGRRSLILNGHLDTKPPGDLAAWETPPYEPVIQDGYLHGIGSADMKGAVAAMVYAAAEVAAAEVAGDLILVFTADEESGGADGARWLAAEGLLAADAAVIGEPSGIAREWEAIRLVSRGVAIVEVVVAGTPMHSSMSDQLPSVNANVAMARLISRFAAELPGCLTYPSRPRIPAGPTVNAALLAEGGVGFGIVPGRASFVSDIRVVPGMTRAGVAEDIRRFLDAAAADDPTLAATFEIQIWHQPCEIDADHPVVAALREASADVLGEAPPLGVFPGGTDAPSFQLTAGIPTVPSFGPGLLTAAHRPNEAISVASIEQATAIYANAARRFLDD